MTPAALAAELSAAYAQEASLYSQALGMAEQWPRCQDSPETCLQRIRETLARVQDIENQLTPVKAAWQDAACRPTGTLAAILAQVADLIQRLQACLAALRLETERQKNELAPALDDVIRRQQMGRAYGQVQQATAHGGGLADGQ